MASRGILTRIGAVRNQTQADAIVEHLNVLLNSRQGECVTAPAFGIPDFTELVHSLPGSIETLVGSIKSAISEFEPRIEAVAVHHVRDDDPLVIKFEISGRIVADRTTLRLQTRMNPGGQVRVSR